MRIVFQRVSSAAVRIDNIEVARIGAGALILLAVEKGDDAAVLSWGARKCAELRVFADEAGKMNRSLLETAGAALVVSQFTLAGDTRKGRRPGFDRAEEPAIAERQYEFFCAELRSLGLPVATGTFAAMMDVELVNAGPVTLIIERRSDD